MNRHEERVSFAEDAVLSRSRLDVTGERGSGRTYLLADLEGRMRARDWDVLAVRGVAPLRGVSLAALNLGGAAVGARDPRAAPFPLHAAYASLRERATSGDFVILIDDWDELDSASWGAIVALRKEVHIPIVVGRLPIRRFAANSAAALEDEFDAVETLELLPFGYDELESVLEGTCDGPIAPALMSRIFAKSGGNPGVAIAMINAAARNGSLEMTAVGWTLKGELWSRNLRDLMESLLSSLGQPQRDAVELLALAGIVDLDTARRLVGWDVLEQLEDASVLRVTDSGARRLVVIVPALLAEYVRQEQPAARRARQTELVAERLGSASLILTPATVGMESFVSEPDAHFVRLLEEQQSISRALATANWAQARTLDAAVPYINELIASSAPLQTIDAAFDECQGLEGDTESTARIAALKASWLIRGHHDFAAARQVAEAARATVGQYHLLIDAALVVLEVRGGRIADDVEQQLHLEEGLPTIVTGRVLEALTHVYFARGQLTKARNTFSQIEALEGYEARPISAVLDALIEFADGELEHAAEMSLSMFATAKARLDGNLLRSASFVAGCALSALGNIHGLGEILDTVVAMGEPPVLLRGETYAVRGMGITVAYHARRRIVGHQLVDDLSIEAELDGLLPTMHWSWPRANILAAEGRISDAADLLWREGIKIWERGGRLSGILAMLVSIEMHPDSARLAEATQRASQVEGRLVSVHLAYVTALTEHDGHLMLEAGRSLKQQGRLGTAKLAFRYAEVWLEALGDTESATIAHVLRAELLNRPDVNDFEYRQFPSTKIELTEREIEVGKMVAHGLSNPQIAEQLVLSTRTVESHVHNLAKKLQADRRSDIAIRLDDYLSGSLVEI